MAALKVLASVSLIVLAIAAQPAFAANDGQSAPAGPGVGSSPPSPDTSSPRAQHRSRLTPEQRAARKAARQTRRAARLRNQQGVPSVSSPN